MEKLKYIKIEHQDGTLSENVPIGVDADNVDIGNEDLSTKLNKLDANDTSHSNSITSLNSSIANLSTQVSSLASGSPAGVYTTVAALTSADPDHSKIYVVTNDGHWYYYSNGWQDGGIYQAAEDSETLTDLVRQVKEQNVTKKGFNLYNSKTTKNNGYWDSNTGAFIPSENMCGSDFIEVEAEETYSLFKGSGYCIVYNDQKIKINNLAYSNSFIIPENGKYIKISFSNQYINTQMLYSGPYNSKIVEYENYNLLIDNNKIANKSIDTEKLSKNIVKISGNLFDKTNVKEGYWDTATGRFVNESSMYGSDFIEIKPNSSYTIYLSGYRNFYDIHKAFISGKSNSDYTEITTPENAYFMTISFNKRLLDTQMIIEGNNIIPYQDYVGYKLNSNLIANKSIDLKKILVDRVIVVDGNGKGDFTKISDAVNSIKSNDIITTILVMPGEYEDTVACGYKHVEIIGIDKYKCKLFNTTGDYNTPPLYIASGCVRNMSIISKRDPNKDYSNVDIPNYAIHIDNYGTNKTLIIENCILHSDFSNTLGCGAKDGQTLEISNCEITGESNGINLHGGCPNNPMNLIMKNNHFKTTTKSEIALIANDTLQTINVLAIGNIAKRVSIYPTTTFILDEDCFGNSNSSLNAIN